MRLGLVRLVAVIAAAVLCAPAAVAQDGPTFSVEFGFGGTLPQNRYGPVTVWVESERPFGGLATLRYINAEGRTAELVMPVSGTPGLRVPNTGYVVAGRQTDEFDVVIRDDRGVVAELNLGSGPGDTDPGPMVVAPSQLVLCLGIDAELPRLTSPDPDGFYFASRDGLAWSVARRGETLAGVPSFAIADPASMPTDAAGYDGVACVLADADALRRLEPRVRAALFDAVRAGGALVLVADSAGGEPAGWLSALFGGGSPIGFGEPGEQTARDRAGLWVDAEISVDSTLYGRALSVTDRGAGAGWRGLLPLADGHAAAVGPAGFGRVAVLGVAPTALATSGDGAARTVWDLALSAVCGPEPWNSDGRWAYWNGWTIDGVADAMDLAAVAEPPGLSVFVGVGIAMVALALLAGPIDFIVLGRLRRRPMSWMSALVWALLASGVALVLPPMFRSVDTTVTRARKIDVLQPASGPSTGWVHGVTGVMAGEYVSGRVSGAEAGGGWGAARVRTAVTRGKWSGALGGVAQADTVVQRGDVSVPARFGAALWTLRAVQDERTTAAAPVVERRADGSYLISAPSAGERIVAVGRFGSDGPAVEFERAGGDAGALAQGLGLGDRSVWRDAGDGGTLGRAPFGSAELSGLAGSADRGDAARWYRAAPGWEVLAIYTEGGELDLDLESAGAEGAERRMFTEYRVVVEVES